jgi:hypothetical protein
MNLFATAAAKATDTKTKKNDKLNVHISGDEFDANLRSFAELKEQFDYVKTQLELVQGFVKDAAKDKYCELYIESGANPGSFIIRSDSDASFLFAPTDKYLSITEDKANELKEEYGDDVVTEDVKFSFNPELLAKYADVLSNLITKSNEISADDKAKLIVASKSFSVSKGTLNKAITNGKGNVKRFMEKIGTIFQMKSPKLA